MIKDIVIGVSENYLEHLLVMLESILSNNSNLDLHFYIFENDFADSSKNLLLEKFKKYGKKIEFVHITEEDSKGFPLTQYFKISTYFRLFSIKKLPEGIKSFLYLDVDLIIDGSIEELLNFDIEDKSIAAVRDCSVNGYQARLEIEEGYPYFNAGVLIVNLEKMRRKNIYDEMIKYIKDKSNALLWLDQDVLNKFFYNDFIELPSVWNYHRFFVLNRGNNIKKIEMDNPVIIHYTGPIKPWDKNDSSVLKKKYDYYHEKLDFETNKKATNKRISLKEFVPIKFLKRVYHFLVKNKVFIYFLKVLNNFKAFRYLKYKLNEKIHFIPHQVIHSYSGVETSIDFIKIETNIIHGIDNILQLPSIIKINGWFLVPSRNITEFEKFICVIDSSGEVKKVFSTTVLEREDINRNFSDEFDYSSSGFITIIDKEKIQEKDFSIGLLLIDKVTKETYFKTTETKISI